MNLNGIMLGTENSAKLAEFYTKVFGEPGWHDADWYGYAIGDGSLMIGNHSEVHGNSQEPARIIISITSKDVKADFEKIKAAGAKVVADPYLPDKSKADMWLATLADPDGNYLQLSPPWEA
jgi:predicted enzyme related to lactoylglutathione lyase